MAAPQGGYPPQEGYGQQAPPDAGYSTPPPQQPASGPASHYQAGGKKKRTYAEEAFEFGQGANAALGGQLKGGGDYPQPQPGYQPPTYGTDAGYGQPQVAGVGGYQPPTPSYPAPGVAQMTQQFGQMGITDPQHVQQPPQAPRAVPLNQLYPTDLLSQPFNVSELDYPPPPIILPPNVCDLLLAAPKYIADSG